MYRSNVPDVCHCEINSPADMNVVWQEVNFDARPNPKEQPLPCEGSTPHSIRLDLIGTDLTVQHGNRRIH